MRFEALALWKLVLASVWNEWLNVLSSGAQWRGEEETVWYVRLCRVWRGSGRHRASAVLERREQHRPRGAFPQDLWRVFWSSRLWGFQRHLRSATRGQMWYLWRYTVDSDRVVKASSQIGACCWYFCVQYALDNKGSMKSVLCNPKFYVLLYIFPQKIHFLDSILKRSYDDAKKNIIWCIWCNAMCLRGSKHIIFHILYIIVALLCSAFLKLILRSEACSDWPAIQCIVIGRIPQACDGNVTPLPMLWCHVPAFLQSFTVPARRD